jgi:glutaminase
MYSPITGRGERSHAHPGGLGSGNNPRRDLEQHPHHHSDFAGRPLKVDQDVSQSETVQNQRKQAVGQLMYTYEYIKSNPMQAVDICAGQCAMAVNAKDLAGHGRYTRAWRQQALPKGHPRPAYSCCAASERG